MSRTLSFLFAFLFPAVVLAYVSPGKPAGYVSDFAALMTAEERASLEATLTAFTRETGNEIAVVTVPTLGGDPIENFAVKLFEEWKIGKKGLDNGALILVARDDREMRIEVGYGLEGALTDAQSSWIINQVMVPAFREGNFYSGISGAVERVMAATRGEEISSQIQRGNSSSLNVFEFWFVLIFFVPLWLASILGRSKSWWAGGVLGGIMGIIVGFLKGFLYTGIVSIALLIPVGLLFDFLVSRSYQKSKLLGKSPPWWFGGGGFGGGRGFGGGGFGGFGGGSSGGGGASGRW